MEQERMLVFKESDILKIFQYLATKPYNEVSESIELLKTAKVANITETIFAAETAKIEGE